MIEGFNPWPLWFILLCGFAVNYAMFVPVETRMRYEASCRHALLLAVAAHSIWIVSAVQWFVHPARVYALGQFTGSFLTVAGYLLVLWAMRSNPYFSAIVEPPREIIAT